MGRRIQILAECPILAEIDVLSVLACPTAGQPLGGNLSRRGDKDSEIVYGAYAAVFFRIVASRWLRPTSGEAGAFLPARAAQLHWTPLYEGFEWLR